MARILSEIFGPMVTKIDKELLDTNAAQYARNTHMSSGALVPIKGTSNLAVTTAGISEIKRIYRFGKSVISKTNYWFQFPTDVDIVRGAVADDTEERTYWTDGSYPKKTKSDLAGLTAGVAITPTSLRMGVPSPGWVSNTAPPSFTPAVSVSGVAGDPTSASFTSSYVITYVTTWNEESAPSNASASANWRQGQSVTVTCPGAYAGAYSIDRIRIYRSNTGSARTAFQFLVELPIAAVTHIDSAPAAELGEACATWDFNMPPDDMIGLTDMGNGFMAGFSGNTVHFSEPLYPYAWPAKYDTPLTSQIVGMAFFGQTLVVGTVDGLVLLSGADPSTMSAEYPSWGQAASSKRSMVSGMDGVVYAAPDGLYLIAPGGPRKLTGPVLSDESWASYTPSSMHVEVVNNKAYCFYDNGTKGCLIVTVGADIEVVDCSLYATATFVERGSDALFLMLRSGSVNTLAEWGVGAALTATWRGRENRYHSGVAMRVARVLADTYPVTYKLYGNGTLQHTQTVANARPFTLPAKRFETVSHSVDSAVRVSSVRTASSVKELGDG